MADARHWTISATVFPNVDAWAIYRTLRRIQALHLTKHFRPSFVGTTKVNRQHLEKAALGL
jgi:hypothetical protein